jgi:hypothetical protein
MRRVVSSSSGFFAMEPARPLVLTDQEHALIGELVEIIGLTDDIMVQTVARLLRVDRAAANKIMGSTNARDNAAIWEHVIRQRTKKPTLLQLVAIAKKEMPKLAEARNDFIHALFETDYVEPGYVEPGYQTTSARRTKSGRTAPTRELESVRNRAATLSCLVAHVDHLTKGGGHGRSPWRGKYRSLLPSRPPKGSTRHRGKVQRPQL